MNRAEEKCVFGECTLVRCTVPSGCGGWLVSAKAAAGVSVSDCVTAAKDSSEYSSSGDRVHSASFRSSLCGMRQVGKREVYRPGVAT